MIPSISLPNKECKNLLSARKSPSDVQELIDKSVNKVFCMGHLKSLLSIITELVPLVLSLENIPERKDLLLIYLLPMRIQRPRSSMV